MHKCEHCTNCYPGYKHLYQHVKSTHFESLPRCNLCDKTFADVKSLDAHKKMHNAKRHVVCPVCYVLCKAEKLELHVENYHPLVSNWVCDACNRTFEEVDDFRSHIKDCAPSDESSNTRRVQCYMCEKQFLRDRDFLKHMDDFHDSDREPVARCEDCREGFFSDRDLLDHEKSCRIPELERVIEKRHKCGACPRTFHNKEYLEIHVGNMHAAEADEAVQCFECEEKFASFVKLLSHVKACHEGGFVMDLE